MTQTLQSVRGMNDILPDEAEFWQVFEDTVRGWLKAYGYRPIRMPIGGKFCAHQQYFQEEHILRWKL